MHIKQLSRKAASLFEPLKFYALNKEMAIEEIAQRTNKNYSTILRSTKQLLKLGLVNQPRLERTAIRGKEKRYYSITLYGLEAYLNLENSYSNIREVARAHSDMLLVFKKWDKFVQSNCEESIISNMKEVMKVTYFSRYLWPIYLDMPVFPSELTTQEAEGFSASILGLMHTRSPLNHVKELLGEKWEGQKRVWEVVENDYELRMLRENTLHRFEVWNMEVLKALAEWRKFFELKTAQNTNFPPKI